MKIDTSIFKAYDIRGVYPDQLNEEVIESITKAYIQVLDPSEIILGRDARVSGPSLHKTIKSTLLEYGVNILDIGLCSSDMYYYACAVKKLPGIMITASHNPKEFNGLKMVKTIPYFITGEDGMQKIKDIVVSQKFSLNNKSNGTYQKWDTMDEFVKKALSLVDVKGFKPFKIVVDPANGMCGPIVEAIKNKIKPIEIVPMYFEPDGTFPNHGGDPLQKENRVDIEKKIPEVRADFGVMFDPDGDRFFVVDKTGRFISGDFMTAILSEYFLKSHPKSSIVYDIRASNIVPESISRFGGKPLYNRVGHSFIKKRMIEENAVFGGEVSGHYYFSDFFYCDTAVITMLYLIDYLSKSTKTLEQIVDDMEKKYFISGEINSQVKDVQEVLDKIEKTYKDVANKVIKVDGVTIEMDDCRFNVRGSNTEPKIRLNLEAKNKELMEQKRDEVLSVIRS